MTKAVSKPVEKKPTPPKKAPLPSGGGRWTANNGTLKQEKPDVPKK